MVNPLHSSVLNYTKTIPTEYIKGKCVLEVGSHNINGSVKPILMQMEPSNYIGCDKYPGDGVDMVVPAEKLSCTFGLGTWDTIITTETLEHIKDWRTAINEMKQVLKPGGLLILTTRSPGFPQHDYPHDYHRFTQTDIEHILRDMAIINIKTDPQASGIFAMAYKPTQFELCDNTDYNVHKAW